MDASSKGIPSKWLDIEALADRMLPEYAVSQVSYFTAIIKTLPGSDAASPQRQQAYLQALGNGARTTIYLGKFRIDKRVMPLHPTVWEPDGSPRLVKVKKTEEKGSDVALASRLLVDAANRTSDLYVVCTNDSDLVMPMSLVSSEFSGQVGLLSPLEAKRSSNELKQTNPVLHRAITGADLAACQLPDEVDDKYGTVRRPAKWA